MDLKNLNETEGGKFFYNVMVGIVTTIIIEFSGLISSDIILPLCARNNIIKDDKNKNINFNNLMVNLSRNLVLFFICWIIIKKITQ